MLQARMVAFRGRGTGKQDCKEQWGLASRKSWGCPGASRDAEGGGATLPIVSSNRPFIHSVTGGREPGHTAPPGQVIRLKFVPKTLAGPWMWSQQERDGVGFAGAERKEKKVGIQEIAGSQGLQRAVDISVSHANLLIRPNSLWALTRNPAPF